MGSSQVTMNQHPRSGKYMNLGDLRELVKKADLNAMPDSATLHTGMTGWRGEVRNIEVRETLPGKTGD